jgi:hypothetical protein
MSSRGDVMYYGAVVGSLSAVLSGFCFEAGQTGLSWSFGIISFFCVLAVVFAFFDHDD